MHTKVEPGCPLCFENERKTPVLAQTTLTYLTTALGQEQRYLIVPKEHIIDPAQLPAHWWQDIMSLIRTNQSNGDDYNISMNIGAAAGQTQPHLHLWVIPRTAGLPSSGKGLAYLITEIDKVK